MSNILVISRANIFDTDTPYIRPEFRCGISGTGPRRQRAPQPLCFSVRLPVSWIANSHGAQSTPISREGQSPEARRSLQAIEQAIGPEGSAPLKGLVNANPELHRLFGKTRISLDETALILGEHVVEAREGMRRDRVVVVACVVAGPLSPDVHAIVTLLRPFARICGTFAVRPPHARPSHGRGRRFKPCITHQSQGLASHRPARPFQFPRLPDRSRAGLRGCRRSDVAPNFRPASTTQGRECCAAITAGGRAALRRAVSFASCRQCSNPTDSHGIAATMTVPRRSASR